MGDPLAPSLSTQIHNYGDVFKTLFVHRKAAKDAKMVEFSCFPLRRRKAREISVSLDFSPFIHDPG
jgi:hypothetical protein